MQLVDWKVATATATRLVPPGPRLPLAEAVATVDQLRALAAEAETHVATYAELTAAIESSAPIAVVDRPAWIRSNVDGFRDLLDPLLDTLSSSRSTSFGP